MRWFRRNASKNNFAFSHNPIFKYCYSNNSLFTYCFQGDGLGPLIGISEEGVISIDPLEEAGPGKVRCNIVGPNGNPLDCEVVENKDGTFDVFYTPRDEGPHSIDLTYGGEKLPDSPYVVKVRISLVCFCHVLTLLSQPFDCVTVKSHKHFLSVLFYRMKWI